MLRSRKIMECKKLHKHIWSCSISFVIRCYNYEPHCIFVQMNLAWILVLVFLIRCLLRWGRLQIGNLSCRVLDLWVLCPLLYQKLKITNYFFFNTSAQRYAQLVLDHGRRQKAKYLFHNGRHKYNKQQVFLIHYRQFLLQLQLPRVSIKLHLHLNFQAMAM